MSWAGTPGRTRKVMETASFRKAARSMKAAAPCPESSPFSTRKVPFCGTANMWTVSQSAACASSSKS